MSIFHIATNKISHLLTTLVCIAFISCKKFVDIAAPQTQIETENVFSNDQSAVSAVLGLYKRMIVSNLVITNGGVTVFAGLSSDELYNTSANSLVDGFTTNALLSDNENIIGRLWQPAYRNIYHANSILGGLARAKGMSEAVKNQLKGEALVARSLTYFYLVNLFGDVPLVTTTAYDANQVMPRTAAIDIYKQITSDLVEAKQLLSATYPSAGRVRPNKWTAAALLARVYLYQKEWSKAEAEATAVISAGTYSLVTNLNNVFLASSAETIWSLMQETNNTAEGQTFVPSSATSRPSYALTNSLLNAFEAGDQRKLSWIFTSISGSQTYDAPYKYKQRASTTPVQEYFVVLRYAEMFLIRSEARAEQNNIAGATEDINVIRTRAGLSGTTAIDKNSLLTAIQKERRIELFAEWAHRWLDLKRLNLADAVLATLKAPDWQSSDILYPIPFNQIQLNPQLTQNPGYRSSGHAAQLK